MLHYTDDSGHKAVASQPMWRFKASKPPGPHGVGAYFTTLRPETRNLAARLRIPKRKIAFVFSFIGEQGLEAIKGDRGEYIYFCPTDYEVEQDRQVYNGPSESLP